MKATAEEIEELRSLIEDATPSARALHEKLTELFDRKSNLVVSLALIACIDADAENADYFDQLRSLVRTSYVRPGVHR